MDSDENKNQEYIEESIYDLDDCRYEAAVGETNNESKTMTEADEVKSLNHMESIYETSNIYSNDTDYKNESNGLALNCTFLANEKKLCFVGNDAEVLPTEMIFEFGLKTLILDLSFNNISDLRDLHQFPNLEELICDNNMLTDESQFPELNSLRIFSCNKNQIENLHTFIDKLKVFFPNLTYLSLLGNKACPNQLIDQNNDEYDYSRYRKYVLYRLKNLKFLDSYEVTQQEREMVAKESLFYNVVKYEDNENDNSNGKANSTLSSSLTHKYTPLPNKAAADQDNRDENHNSHGSYGYSKYIYHGKQSEGNRFIRNDDL